MRFIFLALFVANLGLIAQSENASDTPPAESEDIFKICDLENSSAFLKDNAGKVKDACTKAIEMRPNDPMFYVVRAAVLGDSNELNEAITDVTAAIELNKDYYMAVWLRCRLKRTLKDYHGAINDCDRAIKIDPKAPSGYTDRGWAKLKLKKFQSALGDFNKAIALNNKKSEAYFGRGKLKLESKMSKAEACNDLSKAGELGITGAYDLIQAHCL